MKVRYINPATIALAQINVNRPKSHNRSFIILVVEFPEKSTIYTRVTTLIYNTTMKKLQLPPDSEENSENRPLRVLFLCTGNSCRSQMGEGWARHLKSDLIEAYSAGTKPHGLNRVAVKVMMQAGVDISAHGSKKISRLDEVTFDFVVTVCDNAQESCPVFPGDAVVIHRNFDDPPRLAQTAGSEEEAMAHYIRVRDEIRDFVESMPDILYRLQKDQGPGSDQMTLGI